MTIEWNAPHNDGGVPVTGYIIEKRESRSHVWTEVVREPARVTSHVIQGLQQNVTYYIRVAAENEEGIGAWKEVAEPVRPMKPKSEWPGQL